MIIVDRRWNVTNWVLDVTELSGVGFCGAYDCNKRLGRDFLVCEPVGCFRNYSITFSSDRAQAVPTGVGLGELNAERPADWE